MSLIENLIIMAVVIAALFTAITAQNLALRRLHIHYYKRIALGQAQTLMERFRTVESAEQMSQEAAVFEETLRHLLPQGRSEFHCAYGQYPCGVTIFWQDHGNQSFSLNSLI